MSVILCSYNVFICAYDVVSINLEVAGRDKYSHNPTHIDLKIEYHIAKDDGDTCSLCIPIYHYKNAVTIFHHLIEQIREQQPDKLFIDSKLFGDKNAFSNNSDFIKKELEICNENEHIKESLFKKWFRRSR